MCIRDRGYGDLGCYGQSYISTPNIDNMAKEGMRFTQSYAGSPVSAPSRASFMTGQHSGHCEVRGNKEYWREMCIRDRGNSSFVINRIKVDFPEPLFPMRATFCPLLIVKLTLLKSTSLSGCM